MDILESYLGKMAQDVLEMDTRCGLNHLHAPRTENLNFFCTALAGEVGELLNVAKKIIRDGETEELWRKFDEEAMDVIIYLVELLIVAGTDVNKAWDAKQQVLRERWKFKRGYWLQPRTLRRENERS